MIHTFRDSVSGIDNEKSSLMSRVKFEKKFGQSPVFIATTLMEEGGVPKGATTASLLKEAIHVISCGYEDKTEWGKEVKILQFQLKSLLFILYQEYLDLHCAYCLLVTIP